MRPALFRWGSVTTTMHQRKWWGPSVMSVTLTVDFIGILYDSTGVLDAPRKIHTIYSDIARISSDLNGSPPP
ncbi:hypothetical protein B296_00049101 [Ensete ventricosum]|uniref:Uncharacterized protein n=1 Tax=Ensete ventricosum TaxID=4639 RepID=A0A426XEM5_ENSVE|nr:hypothetical protein B296_00049101 [Ensete ventricosum]